MARRLRTLRGRVAFVGGAVVELLITDPGAPPVRPTKDVDVIVEVSTAMEYTGSLRSRLVELGFAEDSSEGAPICRWIVEGIKVDIMPTEAAVLGFKSAWYRPALESSEPMMIENEVVRIITAPYFLASKLEAFRDRGGGDYLGSQDLEDVIAVIDGRSALVDEVRRAEPAVREYVAGEVGQMLRTGAFVDALPGYLPNDTSSQLRLKSLVGRLGDLARGAEQPGAPAAK